MARLPQVSNPYQAAPAGTAADYLFILRCNEGAAASDLSDDLGVRTMTQTANPTVRAGLFSMLTTGARGFDGATQYAGRTHDADQALIQALSWGLSIWYTPTNTNTVSRLIEFGEHSSAGSPGANTQLQIALTAADGILFRQANTAAGNIDTQYDNIGANTAGQRRCYGVSVEPDLDNIGKCTIRQYLDGECYAVDSNKAVPDGGTAARWIVGASRRQGTAVNAPGSFFPGDIDDVVFAKFTPTAEWFRMLYGNGVRDFFTANTGPFRTVHTRVLVEDDEKRASNREPSWLKNLTDVNLSDISGANFVKSVDWGEHLDDAGATATIKLWPRYGSFSLSPFISDGNALVNLLASMKRIKIETATVPLLMRDVSAAAPYFVPQFNGFITAINVTLDEVTVTAIDQIKPLQNTWIEPTVDGKDRSYGSAAGTAAAEGELQKIIDQNDPASFDIITVDDNGGANTITVIVFRTSAVNGEGKPHLMLDADAFTISGTTNFNGNYTNKGASTTATTVFSNEVSSGGGGQPAELTGNLLAAPAQSYKGRKPTLWTPASPSWNLWEWQEPPSKSVAQCLDDIALQIGFRVAYRWDDLTFAFRLAFYDPTASPDTQDINAIEMLQVNRLSTHDDDTRNVGVVEYLDATAKDPTQERTRKVVGSTNTTSARGTGANKRGVGRRAFRVAVGSDSLITRSNEAQQLDDRIVSDLEEPASELDVDVLYDPTWEVGDIVNITNENSVTQTALFFGFSNQACVVGVSHVISDTTHRTKVVCRKMTSGAHTASISRVARWWELINAKGAIKGRGLSAPYAPSAAPAVENLGLVGTSRFILPSGPAPATDKGEADLTRAWSTTEVHCSSGTGFTPVASTLQGIVAGTSCMVSRHNAGLNFVGGVDYYVKIVHRDRMGNRSSVSAQTHFVA